MSIRFRMFLVISILGMIGFFFLVNWIVDDLRPRYLATMEESMVDTATVLAAVVSTRMIEASPDTELLQAAFDDAQKRSLNAKIYELAKNRINIRVYITDSKGICIFDSNDRKDEGKDYSQWNDVLLTLQGKYGARSSETDQDDPGTSTLYVSAPIIHNGNIAGTLTVCKPAHSIDIFLQTAIRKFVLAGVLTCLAVILAGFFSTMWITRPVQKLVKYAHGIRDGEKPPAPDLGHNEIGMLGDAFEEMRDALEGKKYIENYVQTLTHEMKSPLAAIRGAAELLHENMPVEDRRKFLGNIGSETQRMEDLVERLLELAAIENRKTLEKIEDINIQNLIQDVLIGMDPIIQEKAVEIRIEGDSFMVSGEKFLLRQALVNLIKNAVEFSPVEGQVKISSEKRNGSAVITVEDSGAGIPDYALNRIFDRFFSLERPDSRQKSTGLGLPFVREVATLHRGQVNVINKSPSGVVATFSFPVIRS